MANICYTFEIDGRAAYMAFTDEDDARDRLGKGFDVIELGRSMLRSSSVVSIRPSRRDEIDVFVRLAAEICLAGRVEWEDVMDGYPIFVISGANPDFPNDDINTGMPLDVAPSPRPLGAFGIPIENHIALYGCAPPRATEPAA